jgi:hypothetical protein
MRIVAVVDEEGSIGHIYTPASCREGGAGDLIPLALSLKILST